MPRSMRTTVSLLALSVALFVSARARAQGRAEARPDAFPPPLYPPRTLPYLASDPIPPGYHVVSRADREDLLMGGTLFGASYVASAVVAATAEAAKQPDATRLTPLAIPFIGPFMTIVKARTGAPGGVVLAADGLAQIGGAILFVVGLETKEQILVFNVIPATGHLSVGPGSVSFRGEF